MVGTYAAALAVCVASLAIGQGAMALCGERRWSWLSPAVGLALLCVVCWGTVRLPGDGAISAVAALLLTVAAIAYLRGRMDGGRGALVIGAPVAALALIAASLPFLAEGHFGILGTSFNPDMSQHLLAADHLADGQGSQLLHQGYPLGPHAIVVALGKGLGVGLVQGFSGLTVAVAALAALTALSLFADQWLTLRIPAALVVGLAYMVASYFAQGAFKETMQALFVLAFALSLRERQLIPAALIAAGSVYTYSFPGLLWLVGTAAVWAIAEYVRAAHVSPAGGAAGGTTPEEASATAAGWWAPAATGPAGQLPAVLWGVGLFALLVIPEIPRMVDFHSFETFDPHGPGLGNLFGPISPFEALGIWPSGDFRLSPGDGAVPAFGYYLGAAFASILLVYGVVLCWLRRETVLLSGLAAAALAYVAARIGGTPYAAAKAVEIAAPLAAAVIVLPLLRRPVAWLYLLAAGGCSLLAFANAPVGPTSYSPALTGLRQAIGEGPTLVLAYRQLLEEEHGTPYIAWELRGGRVCIKAADEAGDRPPPAIRFVVTETESRRPPFPGFRLERLASPYVLWHRAGPAHGASPCPLIAVRQARQGTPTR